MRRAGRALLGLAVLLSLPAPGARADFTGLGDAKSFNVFTFGDFTQSGSDSLGRVAVGGDFTSNGWTVASNAGSLPSSPYSQNLVVGGNYTNSGNTVYGNALVGGTATIASPTITGNLSVNKDLTVTGGGSVAGRITVGGTATVPSYYSTAKGTTALPFSFADNKTYLTNESSLLATLSGTTVQSVYNGFTLTGTNANLNVFYINGSQLGSANSLTINAPTGSTVVVNVDGTSVRQQNLGMTINGTDKQRVLFNYYQATDVYTTGIGILGSVLAPKAAFNFAGGTSTGL